MNILAKKIKASPRLPATISETADVWTTLQTAMARVMSKSTPLIFEEDGVLITGGSKKAVLAECTSHALSFSYGVHSSPFDVIWNIDTSLTQIITQSSFGYEEGIAPNTDYKPGLLDGLLFKTVFAKLDSEIEEIFKSETIGFDPAKIFQAVPNIEMIELNPKIVSWVTVSLNFKAAQASQEAGRASDASYSVRILLPQALAQKIVDGHFQRVSQKQTNPDSFWRSHMESSVSGARIPVRAIAETCQMTIAECTRLQIGQVIELPGASLQKVAIEAEMKDQRMRLGTGALGIFKSNRAIKLYENVRPGFEKIT